MVIPTIFLCQKKVPFFAVYFFAISLSILKIQLSEFICFSSISKIIKISKNPFQKKEPFFDIF